MTREYGSWICMKSRCLNQKNTNFYLYGGRGIRVHQPWIGSFEQFLSDVGLAPSRFHTLDRKDPNGNYEPGNVRWATRQEQMENKRGNHRLTLNGVQICLAKAARERGISPSTVHYRLSHGWSEAEALAVPVETKYRRKNTQGLMSEVEHG